MCVGSDAILLSVSCRGIAWSRLRPSKCVRVSVPLLLCFSGGVSRSPFSECGGVFGDVITMVVVSLLLILPLVSLVCRSDNGTGFMFRYRVCASDANNYAELDTASVEILVVQSRRAV